MKTAILCFALLVSLSTTCLADDPWAEQNALGLTDWSAGYVEASGQGTSRFLGNRIQEELMAKQAARTMAQAKLIELIKGIRVSGITTLGTAAQTDTRAATRIKGTLRGAREVAQNITWHEDKTTKRGETVLAEITLRLCLSPSCSESTANLTSAIAVPANKSRTSVTVSDKEVSPSAVIIDLQQAMFFPALAPQIVNEDGQIIYSLETVNTETVAKNGIVHYAKSLQKARSLPESGTSPLVLNAKGIDKENRIIMNDKDAQEMTTLEALKLGRVIIALD